MEDLQAKIQEQILQLFGVEMPVQITVAPEESGADYATNVAMQLAGWLKKEGILKEDGTPFAPRDIALKLIDGLSDISFDVEIAGPGFLNFISRDEYFKELLADMTANFEKNISSDEYSGQTVICEFSDPNPFKVLHVGHLYTSMMGDSISRLVEFAGGKVVRANFGGDVGLHVAKTLWAMQKNGLTAEALEVKDSDGNGIVSSEEIAKKVEIIAQNYVEGTRAYEDDDQARAEITEFNKTIYAINADDIHDTPLAKMYWTGRELSYRYFEDFYRRLGVKFDKYYPESSVASRGLAEVEAHVPDVYEESDGATVFVGERYGLHTRVFINKEHLPTYEAKDVGLLFTKWDDYHFDKSIVITGNDIIDYMKVVLKSVSLYAPDLVSRTLHITHGNVRLPGNEKMSSRKGNFVKAVDVLDAVLALVPDEKVALAAIKYALLKYKIGGNIEFDIHESVSTTGNSGVYLLYSAVRAKKILAGNYTVPQAGSDLAQTESNLAQAESDLVKAEWKLAQAEKNLIRKLAEYKNVLNEAVEEFAPHKIANYLYETAQEFSRFYENVKVNGSEHENERREIVKLYLKTMEHGLGLLGIIVPEEM